MGKAKFQIERRCEVCGNPFFAKTLESRYCSEKCGQVAYTRRKREAKKLKKLQELTEQIDIMSTNVNQEGSTAEERKALQEKIAAFEELISTSDDKGKYERLLAVVKKDDAENSKYRKEIASLNLKINEKTWIANNAQKELDDFKEQTKATMEQLTQRIRTNQETTDKEIAEYKAALAKKDQEINELREELGNNY